MKRSTIARARSLGLLLMLVFACAPATAQWAVPHPGHGSGGTVTDAEVAAAQAGYDRARVLAKGSPFATDVTDPGAVDPAVFAAPGVHLLLAFPDVDTPGGPGTTGGPLWTEDKIQDTARLLLEQREAVWTNNGFPAEEIVPLTVLYTLHDIPGTGFINQDNTALFVGEHAPDGDTPHPLHALRVTVGADFMYVIFPDSEPINEQGWRYYGWQNNFLPQRPDASLIPRTGGTLWSAAVSGGGFDGWAQYIVAHEMEGHGMGGCVHTAGTSNVDLMPSSAPWGPMLTATCTANSIANADYVALNWPPASQVTALEDETPQAEGIALLPGYPNPFRGTTTLSFVLPHPAPVRLAVYDLLGREVSRLADGMHAAGTHTVPFDAAERPAGLYLVRLSTGTEHFTRTLIRH